MRFALITCSGVGECRHADAPPPHVINGTNPIGRCRLDYIRTRVTYWYLVQQLDFLDVLVAQLGDGLRARRPHDRVDVLLQPVHQRRLAGQLVHAPAERVGGGLMACEHAGEQGPRSEEAVPAPANMKVSSSSLCSAKGAP